MEASGKYKLDKGKIVLKDAAEVATPSTPSGNGAATVEVPNTPSTTGKKRGRPAKATVPAAKKKAKKAQSEEDEAEKEAGAGEAKAEEEDEDWGDRSLVDEVMIETSIVLGNWRLHGSGRP